MLLVGDGAGVGVGPGVGEEDAGVGVGPGVGEEDVGVGVGRAKGVVGAQAPRSRDRPTQVAATVYRGVCAMGVMGQIVLETSKSGSGSKQKVAEPWP